jgi:hypothetical protein
MRASSVMSSTRERENQRMNEDQQAMEEEAPTPPLTQSVSMAGSVLAGAGIIDLLAHLGPTGWFVGGLAALVAWRHGPDAYAHLRETLARLSSHPAPDVPLPRVQQGRSVLDRALGRFPAQPSDDADRADASEMPPMRALPERMPAAARRVEPATPSRSAKRDPYLYLAPEFHPHIEEIIGLGIVCYGVKGSGKTNSGALLAEQIGRAGYVPFVVFDLEGDYRSVVEVVPTGYEAGGQSVEVEADAARYLTIDEQNAAEMAAVILSGGYQVVVDLASYPDDETRATIMTRLISGLMRYAERLPNDERVPCLVFIDEAAHWFPQQAAMSYLSPAFQSALTRAVFEMVTMGRKRGIIPAFFTQRPADFDKRLAAQADVLILMRQRQDVDLKRYREYLGEQAEQAASFGRGEAVVMLPNGEKFLTTFYPRRSKHISNTPTAETAYQRFAHAAPERLRPLDRMGQTHRYHFTPAASPEKPAPGKHATEAVCATPSLLPDRPRQMDKYQRGLQAWNEGHQSIRKLAAALGLNFNQARDLIDAMHQRGLINKYGKDEGDEEGV